MLFGSVRAAARFHPGAPALVVRVKLGFSCARLVSSECCEVKRAEMSRALAIALVCLGCKVAFAIICTRVNAAVLIGEKCGRYTTVINGRNRVK